MRYISPASIEVFAPEWVADMFWWFVLSSIPILILGLSFENSIYLIGSITSIGWARQYLKIIHEKSEELK